jgi:hypothetical protein
MTMSDGAIAAITVVAVVLIAGVALYFRRSAVAAATLKDRQARQSLDLADGSLDGDGD